MPSDRSPVIWSRHFTRSQNVKPQASSTPNDIECSGGGCVGMGCVGDSVSPGHAVDGHRALLDWEQRLAGLAVQHEDVSELRSLCERGNHAAIRPS